MTSSLLYGRLCIIIAVIILLFLPLTFTGNNNSNDALAQPHCNPSNNPANYDFAWCWYELGIEYYLRCVEAVTEHNELIARFDFPIALTYVSETCQFPSPPAPLHPLDCNELQTCPIPNCDPTLSSCPEQKTPLPLFPPPLSWEEYCQLNPCMAPLPEGALTPAQEREAARKFQEGLDCRINNPLCGLAVWACEKLGARAPEACGGLTKPVWDIMQGHGEGIQKRYEYRNEILERLQKPPLL